MKKLDASLILRSNSIRKVTSLFFFFTCILTAASGQTLDLLPLRKKAESHLLLDPVKTRKLAEKLKEQAIYSENMYEHAKALLLISQSYRIQSQYRKSMNYLFEARTLFEELKKPVELGEIQNEIGMLYMLQSDYKQAVKYYSEATEIAREHNSKPLLGASLKNLGVSCLYLKQFKKSKSCFQEAITIAAETEDHALLSILYNNLGVLNARTLTKPKNRAENLKILELFQKALLANEQKKNRELEAAIYDNIGDTYVRLQEFDKAYSYLEMGLNISQEINAINRAIESHESLYILYNTKKDHELALHHLQEYMRLKDSLVYQGTVRSLTDLQYEYEEQQKFYQLEILKEKGKIDQLIEIGLGIMCVLLIISCIAVWYMFKTKLKNNKKLLAMREAEKQSQYLLAKVELEKELLERKNLEQEIELNSQQKSAYGLHIIQKQQLLKEVEELTENLLKDLTPSKVKKILICIRQGMHTAEEFRLINNSLEQENVAFFKVLKENYPDLTKKELKMCLLGKLNLDIKTTASFLNIIPNSVSVSRHRIKKKLHFSKEENLNDFLQDIAKQA